MKQSVIAFCLILGALNTTLASDGDVVVQWNEIILAIAEKEDAFLTLKGLRTVTMTHLAMHDALSQIGGPYHPFLRHEGKKKANPIAAATQAAYTVAVSQYPDKKETLSSLRDTWLSTVGDGTLKKRGIKLGEETAIAILRSRDSDGWQTDTDYGWHPMAPGVYAEFNEHSGTPEGFIFGAGWGETTGFALEKPDQFRSPPPPEIKSPDYTKAYDEVRQLGRFQSLQRTPDQTHLALWWKDFVENSHNRLGRRLVVKENLDLHTTARFFSLLNMSVFDAYVSSFNNKFFYNHWRPYTAIRWADNDENPNTQPEPDWNNTHRHTYAFPSYPSAHGTACTAAMTVFTDVFGENYQFRMETPVVDIAGPLSEKISLYPSYRNFDSFSAAAMECAMSRVYLGIHFRYDSEEGFALGSRVGNNVVKNMLHKAKPKSQR